jgi:hypothetical protein
MSVGKEYVFKPIYIPVFVRDTFNVFSSGDEGYYDLSFDLGLSYVKVYFDGRFIYFMGKSLVLSDIMNVVRGGFVYGLDDDRIFRIAFFKGGLYYKLDPISPSDAPTLEISGIKMHRVKDVTPWEDARLKVGVLKLSEGEYVLDVCCGLGYTAINAYRLGAEVVSIENDINVLEIARYNPYSRDLMNIKILLGDAYDVIDDFSSSEFDAIIHDPPRFSRAGQLYSIDFYMKLYRVLKRGGRIFHYTGRVGYRSRGIDMARGVVERMRKAGFYAKIMRDLVGVYAIKK